MLSRLNAAAVSFIDKHVRRLAVPGRRRQQGGLGTNGLQTAIEYKIHWEQELERRASLGVSGPEPLPHPDDIIIDTRTGQVIVKGPMTKEDKVKWDRMYARVEECDLESQR